jgi:hypothetical protein
MTDEAAPGDKARFIEAARAAVENLLQAIEAAKGEIDSLLQAIAELEDEMMSGEKSRFIETARAAIDILHQPLDAAEEKEKGYIKGIIRINEESYKRTSHPLYVWAALSWAPCLRSREELRWYVDYLARSAKEILNVFEMPHRGVRLTEIIYRGLGFKIGKNKNYILDMKNRFLGVSIWAYIKEGQMGAETRTTLTELLHEYARSFGVSFSIAEKAYYETDKMANWLGK